MQTHRPAHIVGVSARYTQSLKRMRVKDPKNSVFGIAPVSFMVLFFSSFAGKHARAPLGIEEESLDTIYGTTPIPAAPRHHYFQ